MSFSLEEQFISQIQKDLIPPLYGKGIGDDAAYLFKHFFSDKILIASDCLCENVHFTYQFCTPEDVMHKLVESNVSDIYVKGGEPKYALWTAGLCAKSMKHSRRFVNGLLSSLKKHNIKMIGGDTVSSYYDFFSLTLLGNLMEDNFIPRQNPNIREGDIIGISKPIGRSSYAFYQLKDGIDNPELREAYARPISFNRPSILRELAVLASMDQSDSLLETLWKMTKEAPYGMQVFVDKIPVNSEIPDPEKKIWALSAAEDLAVVFVCPKEKKELVQNFGFFVIGTITQEAGLLRLKNISLKEMREAQKKIFTHF